MFPSFASVLPADLISSEWDPDVFLAMVVFFLAIFVICVCNYFYLPKQFICMPWNMNCFLLRLVSTVPTRGCYFRISLLKFCSSKFTQGVVHNYIGSTFVFYCLNVLCVFTQLLSR
jgi:hypothetical protein